MTEISEPATFEIINVEPVNSDLFIDRNIDSNCNSTSNSTTQQSCCSNCTVCICISCAGTAVCIEALYGMLHKYTIYS